MVGLAASILDKVVCQEMSSEHPDAFLISLLKFLVEQLVQIPKHGRRYSSNMLTTAFLWQLTSTSLYKKLRLLLVLPSLGSLHRLSLFHHGLGLGL